MTTQQSEKHFIMIANPLFFNNEARNFFGDIKYKIKSQLRMFGVQHEHGGAWYSYDSEYRLSYLRPIMSDEKI